MSERLVAACGLDCTECDIRRVPFDDAVAQRAVAWFHDMGWLDETEGVAEILERNMYCQGCHGDRSVHWSADCWILQCCVDDKESWHCSECGDFPCVRLEERADQNEGYGAALAHLRRMRLSL